MMPHYQLHILCDGHGPQGHNIANFICENYPQILAHLLIKTLNEYAELEVLSLKERAYPTTIFEEDNEEASP